MHVCLHIAAALQGGMMEEWHQKLHNNSSPDDLAICQALLDYLASGQDMQVYWDSLAAQGAASWQLWGGSWHPLGDTSMYSKANSVMLRSCPRACQCAGVPLVSHEC
jgi:alpha-glucan,water dikinase